jgi:putative peptide zinc metalloprotease protein
VDLGLVEMSGALFSPLWFRVSALRPLLRASVSVQRQLHRGERWYQLADSGAGRRHRLNEAAYRFVGRLDGAQTTGQVWDALVAEFGDAALTQDEAIRVLGQLNTAGLLQCELTPDIERLFRQYRQHVRRRRWLELNPLAVRVRLFNPTRLLTAFDPWLRYLFQPLTLVLWLAVVLPALVAAAHYWPELSAFATAHMDTPRYLLIAWIVYPLIKAVHELGHALAVRRWGGQVQDVGFTLFVLVPAPYVDASAASAFKRRSQRALVSGIGIMVELFIAAIALWVWANVQPGWVRDIAFVVMVIGAVSTILLNGNPLLRFDGYHVLCDVFDLPNLDMRSRAWWSNLLQRRVFLMDVPPLPLAPGERKWMLWYAPLAWLYRLYIGMLMALWVGVKSVLLGVAVALGVAVMMIAVPLVALVRSVTQTAQGAERRRSLRIVWTIASVVLALLVLLPLPYSTVAQAVVWLPEKAEVRAETEGFVRELRVRDGDVVKPGQLLAVLEDPALRAKQAEAHSRMMGLRVQYFNTLQGDRSNAQNFSQALAHAETELAHYETRLTQLEIRSRLAGRMAITRQDDLPGQFLKKGQMLGHVVAPGEVVVRAVVADEDAALVRQRARGAAVWLDERPGRSLPAQVRRDVPAASFKLPSAGLSDVNGGSVATDPADTEHLRTLLPIFTVDVALAEQAENRIERIERIGGRAWVRFDFGAEPLAFQWTRSLGQLLLKHFEKAV